MVFFQSSRVLTPRVSTTWGCSGLMVTAHLPSARESAETRLRGCPLLVTAARLVSAEFVRVAQQRAQVGEAATDRAEAAGLDHHVRQGGRLDRASHHRYAARVGGELAQQRVTGAPADDVQHVDVL